MFSSFFPFVSSFLFIYSLGSLLLTNPRRALNIDGVAELNEWNSLKKFLIDFGSMENKTVEMVILWNFYLSYSMCLGIAETANAEIKDFFGTNIYYGIIDSRTEEEAAISKENKESIFAELKVEIEEEYKKL